MTSTLFIHDATDGMREVAHFKVPIKAVFGRRFCDTDGSIGYPTDVDAKAMLETVAECRLLTNDLDRRETADLDRLTRLAEKGHAFFLDWVH